MVLIIDYIRRDKVVYAIVKKSAVDINFLETCAAKVS